MQEALIEAHRTWAERLPGRPEGLAGHRRPAQARRPPAVRGGSAAARGGRRPSRPARAGRAGRRHAAAAVPVLPPGPEPGLGGRAHAARGRRPHHQGDRRGVPGAGGDDGAADLARQAHGLRCRDSPRRADIAVVLRVLYLIFNEGYGGRVDLAAEAIRLTRLLARESDEPEVAGLLALMLLHDARRDARRDEHGDLVPLDEQDRRRWHTDEIAEGVRILTPRSRSERRGRVPDPGRHRRPPRRRPAGGGDRLGADPRLVRRAGRPHREPDRRPQPGGRVGEVDGPLAGSDAPSTDSTTALGEHHRLMPCARTCWRGPGNARRRSRSTAARPAVRPAPRSATTSPSGRLGFAPPELRAPLTRVAPSVVERPVRCDPKHRVHLIP